MRKELLRQVVDVPLDDIIVSKFNTRSYYDKELLADLADSVGGVGQINPVILRRINTTKFELIIGTRRDHAQRMIGAKTIPAFILEDLDDKDAVIMALAENLHRQDLTPFEEAKGILKLGTDFKMSPGEIAKRIGKKVPFIQARLKILSLPEGVQKMLCEGDLSFQHVKILGSMKRPQDQIKYAKLVAKQALSQQDLTTLIHDEVGHNPKRQGNRALFSPQATALKIKRFDKFLERKVRPRLALEGIEGREIRSALRQVSKTIKKLLGHSKQETGS